MPLVADAVVVPAGGSGDVFAAEPNIAGEDSRHQADIDIVLLNKSIVLAGIADNASDTFSNTASDNKGVSGARRVFSSAVGAACSDVFSAPAASAAGDGGLDDHRGGQITVICFGIGA